MPTRSAHRAGGLKHRTNSAGSSKMALNLHFTQKEPAHPHPAHPHLAKAAGSTAALARTASKVHVAPEAHPRRTGSAVRVRDGMGGPAVAPPAPPVARRTSSNSRAARPARGKAGFMIASPSTGDGDSDEDEWLSSEAPSGAATPQRDESEEESTESDDDEPPPPVRRAAPPAPAPVPSRPAPPPPALARPAPPPTLVLEPAAPPKAPAAPAHRTTPLTPPGLVASRRPFSPPENVASAQSPEPITPTPDTPPIQLTTPPSPSLDTRRMTQSATTSPTKPQPRARAPASRALTRPPSMYSVTSRADGASLRPHPLIRGNSYGQPTAAAPAPLALTSTSAGASPPGSARLPSPGTDDARAPSAASALRRTSVSSGSGSAPAAAAEFAVPPARHARALHDRTRTLSTMSAASGTSLAALASLANVGLGGHTHAHPPSPRAPQHLAVHFPPAPQPGALEAIHPLLPHPYLDQHLSALNFFNPMRESHTRVMRAKHGL